MRLSASLGLLLLGALPALGNEGQAFSCIVEDFHYKAPALPLDEEFETLNRETMFKIHDLGEQILVEESTPGFEVEEHELQVLARVEEKVFAHLLKDGALYTIALRAHDEPDEPQEVYATMILQTYEVAYVHYLGCRRTGGN